MYVFFYSFLILFFEFTFIRYIPAHVKATAYFANLTIISTFLGMGIGMILSSRKQVRWIIASFPVPVYLLFFCVHFFSNCQIKPFSGNGEFFWSTVGIHNARVMALGISWVITLFFLLSAACFIPLGYGLGRAFPKYKPLVAYSLDILGSIVGISLFGLLSFYWLPPFIWVLCGTSVYLFVARKEPRAFLVSVPLFLLSLFMVYFEDGNRTVTWSPYYKITEGHQEIKTIYVNDAHHQNIMDMRLDVPGRLPFSQRFAEDYHTPYRFIGRPKEVLVLGAGTGNDVAVALMNGAEHVDAVEIDPVILSIGVARHPNEPYQDGRVTRHNTDARVFLKNATKKYDLIIYATLDSHTILAGQSNMRLDNYLYTLEALQDVKRLLKDDGVFLLEFLALKDYIATRLYRLVETTFGHPPRVIFFPKFRHFNHALLAGKHEIPGSGKERASPLIHGTFKIPTDNWPFLYLRKAFIPGYYLRLLLMFLVTAFIGIKIAAGKELLRNFRPVMFFLGAAFLLLETKSITEFSLLFGSTWTVNLFVILGILIVILLANLLLLRFPSFPRGVLFAGLAGSLLLCYFIPTRELLEESPFARDAVTVVLTGLPILFAAGLFASCFKNEETSSSSLGWNLMGAVVGGLLEYSSMICGIKFLYIIAFLLYSAAGFGILAQRRRMSG